MLLTSQDQTGIPIFYGRARLFETRASLATDTDSSRIKCDVIILVITSRHA